MKKFSIFNFQFSIKNLREGFSLLELLIVITIIGVLTSVILNSISNSRARAYDSKIKQQLSSFRTAAEVYFQNQSPNGYGPARDICTDSNSLFASMNQANGAPGRFIDSANLPTFAQVICGSTDLAYAVKVSLYSGNEYWCVDSRGTSKAFSGFVGSSATSCE